MIATLIQHARRHVIAYLALACSALALGGAAYAQFQIPPGAVGERQLQNHVIDPVKWDPNWVQVLWRGLCGRGDGAEGVA